eukprot:TRINITY_DN2939_c0_g1_i1.p1 TRINITY_DN2939_c0_g1~~TRINITY_DN2939_c0_g1_i1.p1  ORF type:complete len:258 (-),score=43.47 TRINITY_DN2939_c0_g1_i1:402-1175(-)
MSNEHIVIRVSFKYIRDYQLYFDKYFLNIEDSIILKNKYSSSYVQNKLELNLYVLDNSTDDEYENEEEQKKKNNCRIILQNKKNNSLINQSILKINYDYIKNLPWWTINIHQELQITEYGYETTISDDTKELIIIGRIDPDKMFSDTSIGVQMNAIFKMLSKDLQKIPTFETSKYTNNYYKLKKIWGPSIIASSITLLNRSDQLLQQTVLNMANVESLGQLGDLLELKLNQNFLLNLKEKKEVNITSIKTETKQSEN